MAKAEPEVNRYPTWIVRSARTGAGCAQVPQHNEIFHRDSIIENLKKRVLELERPGGRTGQDYGLETEKLTKEEALCEI
jgi:ABC-type branched-subunit amino acid transport system ATPase component